jgi:hypothetical protein
MLAAYKAQSVSVERGFRFLKAPLFFADSLFLKRPERLMALLMVMGGALLVYALAEHTVQTELTRRGESLPDQRGKPTQQPTMRRIFQLFEGIEVLWLGQPPWCPTPRLELEAHSSPDSQPPRTGGSKMLFPRRVRAECGI